MSNCYNVYMVNNKNKVQDFLDIQHVRYVPVGEFPRLTNWTQEVVPGATNIVGRYIQGYILYPEQSIS